MANKKYKEKNIKARQNSRGLLQFQVRFDYLNSNDELVPYNKTFSEKQYGSADLAFKEAVKHKNEMIIKLRGSSSHTIYGKDRTRVSKDAMTIKTIYEESKKYYVVSIDTNEKHDIDFNHGIKLFENKSIQDVTVADIQLSLSSKVNIYSQNKLKRILVVWRLIYKTAILLGYIQYDPTVAIFMPKSKVVKTKREQGTTLQIMLRIIEQLDIYQGKENTMFNCKLIAFAAWIIYYTGIRPSECYALQYDRIDLKNKTILIASRIGSNTDTKYIEVPVKTNNGYRVIPMVPELEKKIKELMKYQPNSKWLFADYFGNPLNSDYVCNIITNISKNLGIKFNLYMLRHLFSKDMLKSNASQKTIIELLGHANIGQTVYYDYTDDQEKMKAVKNRKYN